MGAITIDKILVTPLKRIPIEAGDVLHGIKLNDTGYKGFGEAYFSFVQFNAIKAWKRHKHMTLNLMAPIGNIQFVFFDDQGNQREELIGEDRYVRLTVPPGIWFGFKGLDLQTNLLMNLADIPHDAEEVERKKLNHFKFQWESK